MLPSIRETAPPWGVWVRAHPAPPFLGHVQPSLPRPPHWSHWALAPAWPSHGDPQTEPRARQAPLETAGSHEGLEQHRGRGPRTADGEAEQAGPGNPRALPEPHRLTDCRVLSASSVFSKNRCFHVFILPILFLPRP